jgi:hypothetical protein
VFDADFLATFAKWSLIALAASPIIIGVGWGLVEDVILPRSFPEQKSIGLPTASCDDIPPTHKKRP